VTGMLERIRFRDYDKGLDVKAFTDGYAYDEYSSPYLLSLAGRDSNVKALSSAVISGEAVEITSDRIIELRPSYARKYKILSGRLPGGLLHQMVVEEGFFGSAERPRRLLHVDGKDAAGLVFEAVRSGYPIPVVPEWSAWLYSTLQSKGHIRQLSGTQNVLELTVDEDILDFLVEEGVSSGEISF